MYSGVETYVETTTVTQVLYLGINILYLLPISLRSNDQFVSCLNRLRFISKFSALSKTVTI